jgi:hypothetical protein
MDYEVLKTILCVLEKIKYKADLTPQPTKEEIKEKRERKEELEKKLKEIKEKMEKNRDIATQALGVVGLPLLLNQINALKLELLEGKRVSLNNEDIARCGINFEDDFKNLLKKIKKEYGIIINFVEVIGDKQKYCEIALPKDFDERYEKIKNELSKKIEKYEKEIEEKASYEQRKTLQSIHLIAETIAIDRCETIFLVLDGLFDKPIRFAVKNKRTGDLTTIAKLFKIASPGNAPGKRVNYERKVVDNINNGLFKKRRIKEYLKANNLKKPTLVKKAENGDYLALTGEVPVQTGTISNTVPPQHLSLYIDKTI